MRKMIRVVVFCILLLLIKIDLFASEKTLIFVVDVSGSMRKNELYKKVTDTLCAFILREFKEGDNLVLSSFGNNFYINREVPNASIEQMKTYIKNIENLNFRDDWTYMTLAFGEVAKLADNYRKRDPKRPIYIYIYTDGKNEPPPSIPNPISFKQIIEWYFGSYRPEGTFLYIVTLGVEPDTGIKEIVDTLIKDGKSEQEVGVKKAPPGTVIGPKPTIKEEETKTEDKEEEKKTEEEEETKTEDKKEGPQTVKKKLNPLVFIIPIGIILVIILIVSVNLFGERISNGVYLLQIDGTGNELASYELSGRKKVTPKDLGIQGLSGDAFVLYPEFGSLHIKPGREEIKIIMNEQEEVIGKTQELSDGSIIKVGSMMFKLKTF